MTAAPAVLPGICTRGPGITIATTSNPTTTLYLNLPDSGPLAFDLATTTAGTLLDPAIVRWKVTGAGATPATGTNAGTVQITGTSYTITAWIDLNNNNQIDSGESELQGTVNVVDPGHEKGDMKIGRGESLITKTLLRIDINKRFLG